MYLSSLKENLAEEVVDFPKPDSPEEYDMYKIPLA